MVNNESAVSPSATLDAKSHVSISFHQPWIVRFWAVGAEFNGSVVKLKLSAVNSFKSGTHAIVGTSFLAAGDQVNHEAVVTFIVTVLHDADTTVPVHHLLHVTIAHTTDPLTVLSIVTTIPLYVVPCVLGNTDGVTDDILFLLSILLIVNITFCELTPIELIGIFEIVSVHNASSFGVYVNDQSELTTKLQFVHVYVPAVTVTLSHVAHDNVIIFHEIVHH